MPGKKWEANVVSFPVFRRKPPSFSGEVVGVMSLREATSSDRARRSTKCPVREVLVLIFHRTEVEMKWKMTTKNGHSSVCARMPVVLGREVGVISSCLCSVRSFPR